MKLRNCPVCGKRIPADSLHCPECGTDINAELGILGRKKKNYRHSPVIITAGFLVLLAVIFLVLPRKEKTVVSDSLTGVYVGEDLGYLVLRGDGYADYYCADISFTEPECPCRQENGVLSIDFVKTHCTVTAELSNPEEFILTSDSINWNPEQFTKIDISPDTYRDRLITSPDPKVTVQKNGELTFRLSNMDFTVPKHYVDYEDEFDRMEDALAFVSTNPQEDYIASLLFYQSPVENFSGLSPEESEVFARAFAEGFLSSTGLSEYKKTEVQGKPAHRFLIDGWLNNGFGSETGYDVKGEIVLVESDKEAPGLFILFLQTDNRNCDLKEEFENIIGFIEE